MNITINPLNVFYAYVDDQRVVIVSPTGQQKEIPTSSKEDALQLLQKVDEAIGGSIPAVPTPNGRDFWGFSGVPLAAEDW